MVIKRHIPTVVNRKWSQIPSPEVRRVVVVRRWSSAVLPFIVITNWESSLLGRLSNLRKGDKMGLSPHYKRRSRRGGGFNCRSPLFSEEQRPMLQSGLVLLGPVCSSAPVSRRFLWPCLKPGLVKTGPRAASVPAGRAPPPFPTLSPREFFWSYSCFPQGPSCHCLFALLPSHLSFVRGQEER